MVAGMNMNVWDVSDPIRELIRLRRPVDRRALTDPDVPLSQLIADSADDAAGPEARRGAERMGLGGWIVLNGSHNGAAAALQIVERDGGVDLDAAERAAHDLLVALGADLESDHLRETPRRVAKAYAELLDAAPVQRRPRSPTTRATTSS